MSSVSQYFKGLFGGIGALLTGMSVTWKELFSPKITQQYPENRKTLVMSDRFKGELIMPHDENNEHACTSCGICEMNCPNGTIQIKSKMIETEEGKKKKILDTYHYNLGMCTFCNLCVLTCPSDAIKFDTVFENAIYTKSKLNMKLNQENSKLREKKKPAPKPVADKTPAEKPKEEVVAKPQATEEAVVKKPVTENKVNEETQAKPIEKTSVENDNKVEQTPEVKDNSSEKKDIEKPVEAKPAENNILEESKPDAENKSDKGDKKRFI